MNKSNPSKCVSALHPATIRVLAIASGGGHWHELMQLRPAFEDCNPHFIGIDANWKSSVEPHPFNVVPDAHFDEPIRMIRTFFILLWLFCKIRPHAVVTTGAAPGGLAMLIGRMFWARTLWIDSVANCNVLSRSGRLAMRIAHETLTQHQHLERSKGPFYKGSILS